MLYDSKWDKKPDLWSLDSLIMWLQTKNPKESYNYYDCHFCLLAQYLTDQGKKSVRVGAHTCSFKKEGWRGWLSFSGREYHDLPFGFNSIAAGALDFGEALERAQTLRSRVTKSEYLKARGVPIAA